MKYVVNHRGSTTGKSGREYTYEANEPFEADEGDLDHVGGAARVEIAPALISDKVGDSPKPKATRKTAAKKEK